MKYMKTSYLALLISAIFPTTAVAQDVVEKSYVVPINCSTTDAFHTAVTVLNLSDKAIVANVRTSIPTKSPITGKLDMAANEVIGFDCKTLRSEHAAGVGDKFKGFSIISTANPLSVSATYIAGSGYLKTVQVSKISPENSSVGKIEVSPKKEVEQLNGWVSCENGTDFTDTSPVASKAIRIVNSEDRIQLPDPVGSNVMTPFPGMVVGGVEVQSESRYPSIAHLKVLLKAEDGSLLQSNCGASILDNQWILTAAHCVNVADFVHDQGIPLDLHQISIGVGGLKSEELTRVSSTKTLCHRSYNGRTLENDIALLKLDTPLEFIQSKIEPALLPSEGDESEITPQVWAAGWGTADNDQLSPTLLEVQLVTQNIFPTTFTSVGPNLKESVCFGDSGGPIYDINEPDKLIGLSSYVNRPPIAIEEQKRSCRYDAVVSGFARVSAYRANIDEALSKCSEAENSCFD